MDAILTIEGLSKSFGRKEVLRGLSMSVEKGKVYGLLGLNGEGKTTLIRILMGVIPGDSGKVIFQGRPVRFSSSRYKADIGYIPEDPFFYDWMTVGGLLGFNRGFYRRWNFGKASAYLEKFGLEARARIRTLSRGMKLKLEFVAALAAEPELLVLDDPTSGLDVPTRRDFLREIIAELASSGTTVLFATHLVHELERIVERVGILHGGRLVLEEDFDTVRQLARVVSLSFEHEPPGPLGLEGTIFERRDGKHTETYVYPWGRAAEARIGSLDPLRREVRPVSLEDVFVSFVSRA